eukprot:10865_1
MKHTGEEQERCRPYWMPLRSELVGGTGRWTRFLAAIWIWFRRCATEWVPSLDTILASCLIQIGLLLWQRLVAQAPLV